MFWVNSVKIDDDGEVVDFNNNYEDENVETVNNFIFVTKNCILLYCFIMVGYGNG